MRPFPPCGGRLGWGGYMTNKNRSVFSFFTPPISPSDSSPHKGGSRTKQQHLFNNAPYKSVLSYSVRNIINLMRLYSITECNTFAFLRYFSAYAQIALFIIFIASIYEMFARKIIIKIFFCF